MKNDNINSKDVDFYYHYGKNKIQDILFRWVDYRKISMLKRMYDGKNLVILDYGCGTGNITSQILDCTVYGMDYNQRLLKIARKNGLKVLHGDFEHISSTDNKFDVVISIDTIEHVQSREKAFSEICRVLKADGELIIFTPNYSSPLWVFAEKFVNLITHNRSGHISPFNKESLVYLIDTHFKKCLEIHTINCTLGLYARAKAKA